MDVLLTGGSGFLGSHIAEQLASNGHKVRVLVRKTSNRQYLDSLPEVTFFDGDVTDLTSVKAAIDGVEGVVHAAGIVKARTPQEFRDVNVAGTANLIAAARSQKNLKRFVVVSSLSAIGPSADGKPMLDGASPNPLTHYGRSKLEAERIALNAAAELPVVVIRPPMIYGPRDRETLAFFKTVKSGILPYLGDGKNRLSVIYVSDCARACVNALTESVKSGSVYFVEDGNIYIWKDMLQEIEKALGKKAFLRFSIPFAAMNAAALGSEIYGKITNRAVMLNRDKLNELAAPNWVCDGSKARSELRWQPRFNWERGVREAASWYKTAGWL